MALYVPEKNVKSIKLFESGTMKDVMELAHAISWSIPSRNIMLEYNSPGCTVEFMLDEFIRSFKEHTMIGLEPNHKVHIPTIELYARPPQVADKNINYFARYSPSDPDRIGIHPWMLDYCKGVTKDSPGYNRIVFFGAISIVNESFHLKQHTFKELRGTVIAPELIDEPGEHREFQLLQGRLELIFKTCELMIESEEATVKVIDSRESRLLTEGHQLAKETPITTKKASIMPNSGQNDNIKDLGKDEYISENTCKDVYTNVKLRQVCRVQKIKQDDEHKYILETTIENTSDAPIEIPENADPGILNLRLKSLTRGGINPNERGKITRCIENMVGLRKTIFPGQMHTYKIELNDLFRLTSDLYQIKCHFTLQSSEKKKYFLTDESSLYFLVGSKSENKVVERLTIDLDPDFIKVIRLRINH